MRKIYIAGNWKLNFGAKKTKDFLDELKNQINDFNNNIEVLVHPPFTSLAQANLSLKDSKINFGAQNCSHHSSGAYTGEVSIEMLIEAQVSSIIIGHSERRELFKETDEDINNKLKAILDHEQVTAIVCCGESQEIREAEKTDEWVSNQIEQAFTDIKYDSNLYQRIVIAYEPIWAIGTGKTCDAQEANRVIKVIRNKIKELYSEDFSSKVSILYGGSVNSSNIEELIKSTDIDGALIGGSSLKTDEFSSIIKKTNSLFAKSL